MATSDCRAAPTLEGADERVIVAPPEAAVLPSQFNFIPSRSRRIAVFDPVGADAEPVGRVVYDTSPFRSISSPGHPAADEQGNLKLPNVNPAKEMAGLRAAMGAYEANLRVIATLDDLNSRTIDLLKV